MPKQDELIAHNRTTEEVCREIGADGLVYQDLGDLKRAVMDINPAITSLDSSCFDGVYVTGDIDADYLERLNSKHKKKEKASSGTGLQLNMGFKDNN